MGRKRADYSDIHPSHADVIAVVGQVGTVAENLATLGTTIGTVGGKVTGLEQSVQGITKYLKNRVLEGFQASTSDSTAHGDGGAYTFDATVTLGIAVVDGDIMEHPGGKVVVAQGAASPLTAETPEVKFMTVAFNTGGVVAFRHISGVPAAENASVPPTDEQITTELGSDKWIPLFMSKFLRATDASAVGSMDNTVKKYF